MEDGDGVGGPAVGAGVGNSSTAEPFQRTAVPSSLLLTRSSPFLLKARLVTALEWEVTDRSAAPVSTSQMPTPPSSVLARRKVPSTEKTMPMTVEAMADVCD